MSDDFTPEDDCADRKARRQFGQHGHIVFALMIVVVIAIVKWVPFVLVRRFKSRGKADNLGDGVTV